jgi:hypothetical protein
MSGQIIALATFIDAIRDAGYRGTPAAISELVDNAIEAGATNVTIELGGQANTTHVSVADNGCGMTPETMRVALQFGGSTRFDSRVGLGRYGMGLPGSSMSQALRVDVYSWTTHDQPWWTFLDVAMIRAGAMATVPKARRAVPPFGPRDTTTGTIVHWTRCDRIPMITPRLVREIHEALGRVFREYIWAGVSITVNDVEVAPVDPLFLRPSSAPMGAVPYGPPLLFPVHLQDGGRRRQATVSAQFVELPISAWEGLSNADKRRRRISKSPGISILRADREIDAGWFFMGSKRKENYDDWWRAEVRFSPELDSAFGVTHTKQGIHPTSEIEAILTPQMERVAHDLNARVRKAFLDVRAAAPSTRATDYAAARDHRLEPPKKAVRRGSARSKTLGLTYSIEHAKLSDPRFFVVRVSDGNVRMVLNEEHPFFRVVYGDNRRRDATQDRLAQLELLLLAAARAEVQCNGRNRVDTRAFLQQWSDALGTFLT